ncbi:MAG: DUF115 domain-containing protein [Lachnospiraceae bacterium]|nr:DUF115 domain-containing protein [Lachnospiraceae bacterium]
MNIDLLRNIYWDNAYLITDINRLLDSVRIHDLGGIWTKVKTISTGLAQNINRYYQFQSSEGITIIDLDQLMQVLQHIYTAQEQKDYILMGDYYEWEILPLLYQMQSRITDVMKDEPLYHIDWLEKNLNLIRQQDESLYAQLVSLDYSTIRYQYCMEPSNAGYYTLSIIESDHKTFLHSNIDPMQEARKFAGYNYRIEKECYLAVGMGLGYSAFAFKELFSDIELVAAEPDLNILYCACLCQDLTGIIPNIRFIYGDEIWSEVRKELAQGAELILYPPTLSRVRDKSLRRRFEDMMNRKNGIRRHESTFYQNHRSNLRCCDNYIDTIGSSIKGKKVIIAAGGPSLDNNIKQLHNISESYCVIAVGTVFGKLLNLGIRPDYVIASDVNAYHQFEHNLTEQIPVLLLSTADRRIAQNYQGKKYLICHTDYGEAADYAVEHGYQVYDSGGSVTTLALDLAIRMEAESIAFIGLDLAYDGDRFHAADTQYEVSKSVGDYTVSGLHGETLCTDYNFIQYKQWIEERIIQNDVTMTIYDASEGGARIDNTVLITLHDYIN